MRSLGEEVGTESTSPGNPRAVMTVSPGQCHVVEDVQLEMKRFGSTWLTLQVCSRKLPDPAPFSLFQV